MPTPPGAPRLQHFLLTRFNLRIEGYERDKNGAPVHSEDWYRERFELFDRYCFPSVRGQSAQGFTWLLYVDEASPPHVRARFDRYAAEMPNLELVPLGLVRDQSILSAPVLQRCTPDTTTLVTTRLDNDDALHRDAIRVIQGSARGRREFLNLRLGYETQGRDAAVVSHKYGHFSSLIEPRGPAPFLTVFNGVAHGHARRIAPVRQYAAQPLWIRVIHERNLVNRSARDTAPAADRSVWRRLHRRLRQASRRMRQWFWPARYRQIRPLAEIAPEFNLDLRGG